MRLTIYMIKKIMIGGMAITQLKEIAAARSVIPTLRIC